MNVTLASLAALASCATLLLLPARVLAQDAPVAPRHAAGLDGLAELRVRGLSRDFSASTAEWTVGAAYRF